jgi:hypothetical protein|tara:strand:+ start:118 stop:405 length:288 start_codon:yes stop_codon:yes gene_type:complete
MKKIKSVNIISLANFTAGTTVLGVLTATIFSLIFGGLLGGMMGGGGADLAGGGFVAGLITTVIAAPISWIIGLIYGFFINLTLKIIGGLSIEIEG